MEDKFIEISFNNQKFLRYPKVKIFIDGDLLEEKTFEKQKETVTIPVDMIDGDHLLEIEHFDKTNRDTEYKNGEILRDTKFTIEKINICSYDIPYSFFLNQESSAHRRHNDLMFLHYILVRDLALPCQFLVAL